MKLSRICAFLFAATFVGACAGTGEVEYGGGVNVASPDLVEVQPGVQVIADADDPVFYSDGFYWAYRDGYWMRSSYYNNGFARVDVGYVPVRVRGIDNPRGYAHYRRHEGRGYARPAPYVRHEERASGGVYVTPGRPAYREERGPVIRDHRSERREERREEHREHHDRDHR